MNKLPAGSVIRTGGDFYPEARERKTIKTKGIFISTIAAKSIRRSVRH